MKIDGQCHCGAIAYEAEIDPATVRICHCADCQRLSGTAFRVNVPCREQDFRLLRGEPKVYVRVADSGNRRQQTFCASCGSPIYSAAEPRTGEGMLSLRIGTIAQRRELVPSAQIFRRSALPWVPELPGEVHEGDWG